MEYLGAHSNVVAGAHSSVPKRCRDEPSQASFFRLVRQRQQQTERLSAALSAAAVRALKRARADAIPVEGALFSGAAGAGADEDAVGALNELSLGVPGRHKRARPAAPEALGGRAPLSTVAGERAPSYDETPGSVFVPAPIDGRAPPTGMACAHRARSCTCGATLYTIEEVEQLVRGVVAPSFERALAELAEERATPRRGEHYAAYV